jgi:hypothetical protein
MVKEYTPTKELFVAAPPHRFGSARDLGPRLELTKGRIAKSLLPAELLDEQGNVVVRRPTEYDPA